MATRAATIRAPIRYGRSLGPPFCRARRTARHGELGNLVGVRAIRRRRTWLEGLSTVAQDVERSSGTWGEALGTGRASASRGASHSGISSDLISQATTGRLVPSRRETAGPPGKVACGSFP